MPTLQQTLADATRPLHQRIEANPFMSAMKQGDPLASPYRWLLSKLYPFAQGAEDKLVTLIPESEGFDTLKRCRADLLVEDLLQLDIIPESGDTSLFDTIDTTGKAIGLLYVLEGSRKGGQFLSSLLKKNDTRLPMRYLLGYGETTNSEWERFCGLLERYTEEPMRNEIISGALGGFEILERIFHDTHG